MTEATVPRQRVLSGIQPSGQLHLGNYFAMMKRMIEFQAHHELFCFIVNYHALTTVQDGKTLRQGTLDAAMDFLALGLDPEQSIFWVQSDVPEVTELTWILSCVTSMGLLERCHSYKDKIARGLIPTHGLFAYPVLMAADILLYQTDIVPVGDDQKQHVELTRDLAERFNSRYGTAFTVPIPVIQKDTARIYDLQNPTAKMSKSAESDAGVLWLLDDPAVSAKKIMRAVTDNDGTVRYDREAKPGVSNLLTIYAALTGRQIPSIEDEYAGRGYGDFKKGLAEVVVDEFGPVRSRALELLDDPAELDRVLASNADRAALVADATLADVYDKVGLLRRG